MIRAGRNGFTLIEVLVALAVFGILTILAYATLGQTLSNADMLNSRMERLKQVQRAVRMIDADLMQAAPRPIRDPLTEGTRPAFVSDSGLDFAIELTHLGWNNPAGLPRSNQQRSAYRVEDGELVRYHWNVLDRTLANEPLRAVLLDGVDSLTFLFQKPDGEWVPTWPARSVQLSPSPQSRPRAVEVLLTLTNEGEIRRLLEVAP